MNYHKVAFERSFGTLAQLPPSDLPELVFAGRCNVGKSSLINKIFNHKQLAPVGSQGQLIIDYSIYDARRAGFETVVFVIKEENEAAFRAGIGDRLARAMDVRYAYQRLEDLPEERIHWEKF